MDSNDFNHYLHAFSDWISDYVKAVGHYPVGSLLRPGDISKQLPDSPPERGEPMDAIFRDFLEVILPGITHWQHPSFFAYFPASRSEPSILAEMLTAALGAQCMLWYTSPAAEELEDRMMAWIRDMIGLPPDFTGVIQDTASTATLVSLLTAREKASGLAINQSGFSGKEKFRIYTSVQAHSSVDKAIRITGIGHDNLVKIPVDHDFAMDVAALGAAIREDLGKGFHPLAVVATFGTTGSTAIDPLAEIGRIAGQYGLWYHVDAAYAGAALLLPEYRFLARGMEMADTIVFNPHKWLFTNFDCSVYLVKDPVSLVNTFNIMPEYLKTPEDRLVNNYRDWGIQLGRRFRALKLWFVIRYYGREGLQKMLREHIGHARWLRDEILRHEDFELLAPVLFGLVCFRFKPSGISGEQELNRINQKLLHSLNDGGKIFMTHTVLDGKYTLRLVGGNTAVTRQSVEAAWEEITRQAAIVYKQFDSL
ncbi:MAG TPA: pyridoxal-dependent decarboxylase [Bacteroidales bacterium]|nr:pyridoxal-dependent decarboxylase [Bacteroidales bacterium]HSA42279.1 pyridoxal-dependent decarboxylase [Bacteroidales bacterium]